MPVLGESELSGLLGFARSLIAEAADLLPPRHTGGVRAKYDESVVTDADLALERMIARRLRATYADHALVGEESHCEPGVGPAPSDARWCWVVDPLDGTRNYVAGLPCYATSIAVLDRGEPVVGVIYEHNTRESFWAVLGGGVFRNGRAVHVRTEPVHGESLVAFPSSKDRVSTFVATRWTTRPGLVCRNLGSTAYHLALLAAGALDAVFACRCKIWDIAAGALMVREGGGVISGLTGESRFPWRQQDQPSVNLPILASGPALHADLTRDLASAPIGAG